MRLAKGQLGRLSVPRGPAIVTDRLSSVAEFAHRDATFSIKPEDESMSDEILRAYHQAIARHQERTGVDRVPWRGVTEAGPPRSPAWAGMISGPLLAG